MKRSLYHEFKDAFLGLLGPSDLSEKASLVHEEGARAFFFQQVLGWTMELWNPNNQTTCASIQIKGAIRCRSTSLRLDLLASAVQRVQPLCKAHRRFFTSLGFDRFLQQLRGANRSFAWEVFRRSCAVRGLAQLRRSWINRSGSLGLRRRRRMVLHCSNMAGQTWRTIAKRGGFPHNQRVIY